MFQNVVQGPLILHWTDSQRRQELSAWHLLKHYYTMREDVIHDTYLLISTHEGGLSRTRTPTSFVPPNSN